MLRQFLRHGLIYGAALGAPAAVSIVLLPVYTRQLSPAELGVWDLTQSLIILANLVVPLEVIQAVYRLTPETLDPARRRLISSTGWWFSCTVFLIASSAVYLLGSVFSSRLPAELQSARTIGLLALALASFGLAYYSGIQFRCQLHAGRYAALCVARALLIHGLSIGLIIQTGAGLDAVLAGQAIGNLLPTVCCAWIQRDDYRIPPDAGVLRDLLRYSLPFVPAGIASFAMLWVDRVALGALMSMSDVGRYGIAVRFASVISLASNGILQALNPILFVNHEKPQTRRLLKRLIKGISGGSLMFLFVLDFFGAEMLLRLTAPAYRDIASIIVILSASGCCTALAYLFPGLLIAKKTGVSAVFQITAAASNSILAVYLIPLFGLTGAAISTFFSSLIFLLLNVFVSQKHYPVDLPIRRITLTILGSSICLILHHNVSWSADWPTPARIIVCAIALLALFRLLVVPAILESAEPTQPIAPSLPVNPESADSILPREKPECIRSAPPTAA